MDLKYQNILIITAISVSGFIRKYNFKYFIVKIKAAKLNIQTFGYA
jgi:hypothetical protein